MPTPDQTTRIRNMASQPRLELTPAQGSPGRFTFSDDTGKYRTVGTLHSFHDDGQGGGYARIARPDGTHTVVPFGRLSQDSLEHVRSPDNAQRATSLVQSDMDQANAKMRPQAPARTVARPVSLPSAAQRPASSKQQAPSAPPKQAAQLPPVPQQVPAPAAPPSAPPQSPPELPDVPVDMGKGVLDQFNKAKGEVKEARKWGVKAGEPPQEMQARQDGRPVARTADSGLPPVPDLNEDGKHDHHDVLAMDPNQRAALGQQINDARSSTLKETREANAARKENQRSVESYAKQHQLPMHLAQSAVNLAAIDPKADPEGYEAAQKAHESLVVKHMEELQRQRQEFADRQVQILAVENPRAAQIMVQHMHTQQQRQAAQDATNTQLALAKIEADARTAQHNASIKATQDAADKTAAATDRQTEAQANAANDARIDAGHRHVEDMEVKRAAGELAKEKQKADEKNAPDARRQATVQAINETWDRAEAGDAEPNLAAVEAEGNGHVAATHPDIVPAMTAIHRSRSDMLLGRMIGNGRLDPSGPNLPFARVRARQIVNEAKLPSSASEAEKRQAFVDHFASSGGATPEQLENLGRFYDTHVVPQKPKSSGGGWWWPNMDWSR